MMRMLCIMSFTDYFSADPGEGTAKINSDVTLYLSKLDQGNDLSFHQKEGRKMYVFVMEGELVLHNDVVVKTRDSARISDLTELKMKANKETFFLFIDLGGE